MITKERKIEIAKQVIEKLRLNWIKGEYALNRLEEVVYGDNPDAYCWCLDGAVQCICLNGSDEYFDFNEELDNFIFSRHGEHMLSFNDAQSNVEDVIKEINSFIEFLEKS